jgi:hypothetical protein
LIVKPFLNVAIPVRMIGMSKDRRGYPVPYIVFRDSTGRPHFTINSDVMRAKAIREDRCSICGQKLLRGRWYVGGPKSAFHPHGAYVDPAMHKECVEYALQVCPFLAMPSYAHRIDAQTLSDKTAHILADNTQDPGQPELFVAVMTTGAKELPQPTTSYFKPRQPYVAVTYWRAGVQLDPAFGHSMAMAAIEQETPKQAPRLHIPKEA